MRSVFTAAAAIFGQSQFFCSVYLVTVGDVVLTLAHRADEPDQDALFFFGHKVIIIAYFISLLKQPIVDNRLGDFLRHQSPAGVGVMNVVPGVYVHVFAVPVFVQTGVVGVCQG